MELSVAQPPGRPESRLGHPVIDMRCRPSFLHRFFGAEPGTPEFATVRWLNGRVGSRDPDHFTRARDLEGLLAELAALADRSGGRLIGVASVDPTVRGRDASLAELHRAVLGLGLAGLNVDAGFYATALSADDERLMPLYEACAELGVPAFIMSGPTTPDLRLNDPLAVDAVARAFPGLSIVCCHGFYPNVDAMLAVAFRNPNVFVSPDMYVFAPGGGRYVEAANGFLADQFLFGTSYPFRPLRQSVEDFLGLGLAPESLRKAMADNPARLLRLPG
jgi:predicted TIM-barrel fold metal-dependent hydrolase